MSARHPNAFKLAKQHEKASRLVNILDRLSVANGLDPLTRPLEVVARFADKDAAWWALVARAARCNEPSPETIELVVQRYQARVEPTARAS